MKTTGVLTLLLAATALESTRAREMVAGSLTGLVSQFVIATPDLGSCRLQGIGTTSDNFKNFASVSMKDATLNEGCARCIKVTRDDDTSKAVTAYVLDVAQGSASGTLKLSSSALTTLAIDVNANNVSVSYKFINCPSSLASGNVRACLMDGASNAYIPLQFTNAQKVIASVKINGVDATASKDQFLFSATSGQGADVNPQWFQDVSVEMTSTDGETLKGNFAFGAAKSGCATFGSQFSAASTADGTTITDTKNGGKSDTAMLLGLFGGAAALLVVIASVFFIRRRRVARAGLETPNSQHHADNNDVENQYLEPLPKAKAPPSPAGPSYPPSNNYSHEPELRSPTIDYEQSYSPAASFSGNSIGDNSVGDNSVGGAGFGAAAAAIAATSSQDSTNSHSLSSGGSSSSYSYNKPTYSFSSNVSTSPRRSKAQTIVPTFQAPVVPTYAASRQAAVAQPSPAPVVAPVVAPAATAGYAHPSATSFSDSDSDNERSSFDIDDMRSTEEMKSQERGDLRYSAFGHASSNGSNSSGRHTAQLPPPSSEYATGALTSPQSYVRATSLRRNTSSAAPSTVTARAPSSGGFRSNSSSSVATDAYDAGAPFQGPGSLRESSGYSRDSLSILGYPYAKKNNSSRGYSTSSSITEAQF